MLFKSALLLGAMVANFAGEVSAHAAINPALGVKGTAVRNDVQRPSNNKPCGNTDLGAIDTSTSVTADATGSFTVDIENFNGGKDGSRQVTMQVDAAGTGANFVAGKVTANGDGAPASTGTEKITASLPAGTTCTGGASGNLCLASFKTSGGFGNCVVVQQGGAGQVGATTGNGNGKGNGSGNGNGNGQGNRNGNGNGNAKAKAGAKNNRRAAGTRLARYVVDSRE